MKSQTSFFITKSSCNTLLYFFHFTHDAMFTINCLLFQAYSKKTSSQGTVP